MSAWLGQLLVKERLISDEQLRQAADDSRQNGGRLQSSLVKLGFTRGEDIALAISRHYGIPYLSLRHYQADAEVAKLLPYEMAVRYQVLPLSRMDSVLTIAMADPTNVSAMDDIKFLTGLELEPVVSSEDAIAEVIQKIYGEAAGSDELDRLIKDMGVDSEVVEVDTQEDGDEPAAAEKTEQAPIIRLVNLILAEAVERGASDIHIEPSEKHLRVRYRIDGVLESVMNPPLRLKDAITSRIKVMAKLDISEKRLPQDGRIKTRYSRAAKVKTIDLRVSTIPTLFGEKVVLRLLDQDSLRLDMRMLGFESGSLEAFERAIGKPYGMVLVTGPTGSGKTNTLYSVIARLNTPDRNILTAEDPVEFQISGINQVQVKDQIGLTFASALRAFLRQDPNIILVGEIRDQETAEIAIKAALTGHLVFSTMHTNDAPSAISRLINMKIEPFLVATSVNLLCAQRLVRRVCRDCSEPVTVPLPALIEAGFTAEEAQAAKLMRGRGCSTCRRTGYRGRMGLFEVMEVDAELREMILVGASALELKRKALEHGMITLRQSGLRKVAAGVTTLEEVLRETIG
ncbi:MAG TPA: type IV-A pilus assembly ATPase PilB [Patescibacteria group bacterium]|nr:type IV-A pilus assembly ATPase PilB [Patescibacteria group bacterium]